MAGGDLTVVIKLDEQQIEDLLSRIQQAVRPQITKDQLDKAIERLSESTVRQVRELVEQGRL